MTDPLVEKALKAILAVQDMRGGWANRNNPREVLAALIAEAEKRGWMAAADECGSWATRAHAGPSPGWVAMKLREKYRKGG